VVADDRTLRSDIFLSKDTGLEDKRQQPFRQLYPRRSAPISPFRRDNEYNRVWVRDRTAETRLPFDRVAPEPDK